MFAKRVFFWGICIFSGLCSNALAEVLRGELACGAVTKVATGVDFGPFDYRTAPEGYKHRVEAFHFTPNVERLQKANSGAYLGSELDFVLRYFPNHVRALIAMTNLAKRDKTDRPRGSNYRLDCLYDRAVRMAPTDVQVRVLYGIWLAKKGERALAREQLDQVTEESQDSLMLTYNLGLAYLEIGEYDKALAAAHKAYGRGFELPGLRNRLVRAGKWREPVPEKRSIEAEPKPEPERIKAEEQ